MEIDTYQEVERTRRHFSPDYIVNKFEHVWGWGDQGQGPCMVRAGRAGAGAQAGDGSLYGPGVPHDL